jgi:hypothetical protein
MKQVCLVHDLMYVPLASDEKYIIKQEPITLSGFETLI